MLSLGSEVEGMFFEINLKAYFTIQKDAYRLTLFDIHGDQTMMFIPKKNYNQISAYKKYIMDYTKRKHPELFL